MHLDLPEAYPQPNQINNGQRSKIMPSEMNSHGVYLTKVKPMCIHQPEVSLFLYDFKQGFGNTETEIREMKKGFYGKMPDPLVQELRQQPTSDDLSNFRPLLEGEPPCWFFEEGPLEGLYYPTILGDTYGLVISIAIIAIRSVIVIVSVVVIAVIIFFVN